VSIPPIQNHTPVQAVNVRAIFGGLIFAITWSGHLRE
jgi:hypothetical protein